MASEVTIVGRDSGFFASRLAVRFPAVAFRSAENATAALDVCAESDVLIIRTDQITAALVDAMPRLRLIQALTTGTDHIEALRNLPPEVIIAAARGFHGPQM
jgi:phosphoglycerate dehydrogenase-like enzyme